MSNQTAAIEKSMDSVPCNQEKKDLIPPINDLKEPSEAPVAVAAVAVAAKPEGSGGEAVNQGSIENKDSSPSKPPSKKGEKADDTKSEDKIKQCSSNGSADPKPTPTPQPSASPRKEASANDTKDADTARSPPAKEEHKEQQPEKPAKENSGHGNTAPKSAQVVTTNNSPAVATNKNVTAGTTVESSEAPVESVESKNQQSDAATATAQEKSNEDGEINQNTSPSLPKKKKSKKKKKKRKTANPDNNPAQTKPAESPDQNQKTNSAVAQESVQDEKSELKPVSGKNKKGADSSENAVVAPTASTCRPSKSTKAAAAAPKVEPSAVKAKSNEKREKASGSSGKAIEKGPTTKSTDVSSKTSPKEAVKSETTKEKSNQAKKPDTNVKSEASPPCESSSSPSKKDTAAAQDNHAKSEEADDGAWETVEVKPRGKRTKGGNKKSSSGAQNKTSNNSNNASNNAGRNHTNDNGGNNNDGGGNSNHGGRRRNKRHRDRADKRSINNQQQQQNKLVKDVIFHILEAVDVEVARRGGNGVKQGGNTKSSEDGKRNKSGNNEKRSVVSVSNCKHHGQQHSNEQRRKQSIDVVAGKTPPPLNVSNSSAKSLRDVLVGSSAAAVPIINPGKAQVKVSNTASGMNDSSQNKAKDGAGDPEPSKGSSKIKPGLSYKSVIEPAKPPEPQPTKPQPPKPKLNAWAKLPVSTKVDSKPDVEKKTNLDQQPPTEKKSSDKPVVRSSNSSGLVPLVPLATDSKTPSASDENKEKDTATVAAAVDNIAGEAACRTPASVTDNDTTEDAPSPPLSTLLGPGNSCSASSSVASSLEAPHSSNRFRAHPSSSLAAEDDVGYHLLNVCGQLSEEINTFMSRRALALDVRRKERNAVMCALGDTLGKIWPSQCCVEMYGSCATQLDLPSSDLDLVVCGLDDVVSHPPVDQQTMSTLHGNKSSNSFQDQQTMGTLRDNNSSNSFQDQQTMVSLHGNDSSNSFQDQQTMVTLHGHNSSNSFQEEEIPEECDAASIEQHGQEQPMSPDQHLAENSLSGSIQEGSESPTSPDPSAESAVEGDPGMTLDESADGMLGIEYSSAAGVENYSLEYHESNQQEGAAVTAMENYSPGYSYHSSQQDLAAADNYSPGYQADEMGMEGYGHEYQTNGQEFYYSPYDYVSSLSLNAQRVLRLASELELQPWAVQVKAIPTATVPVVKMLADPSRLPGLAGTGDSWMMQQHIAAQAGVATGTPPPPISPEQISVQNQGPVSSSSHFFSPHPMAQWRGTDIKNGLQPVDITFEGPEHGGIASTAYSTGVVGDACEETGLSPESTPVVQVASVLKELLAQRRLNEPFSGGLSSYGLLMLLLAVLKDRKIIQKEMKKMEKQRQKVSGPDNREADHGSRKNNAPAAPLSAAQVVAGQSASPCVDLLDKSTSTTSKPTISSSWASIAKKSNGSTARTESLSSITKSTNDSATILTAKTGVNYSQVVQKESKENTKNVGQGKDQTLTEKQLADSPNGDLNARPPAETECLSVEKKPMLPQSSNVALDGPAVLSQVTPFSDDDSKIGSSSVPQGTNDVFEVLCSGELTSGKLLMHFLLFYGQHFDSQATLIDINGTQHPEYGKIDLEHLSPFVARPPGGTIDPVTGMFSVDPIVVYDPLEGAIKQNVAKRCYCWNNVRWVFAQCYMTVSSVVETSDTCTKSSSQSKHKRDVNDTSSRSWGDGKAGSIKSTKKAGSTTDIVTPILELLLSF